MEYHKRPNEICRYSSIREAVVKPTNSLEAFWSRYLLGTAENEYVRMSEAGRRRADCPLKMRRSAAYTRVFETCSLPLYVSSRKPGGCLAVYTRDDVVNVPIGQIEIIVLDIFDKCLPLRVAYRFVSFLPPRCSIHWVFGKRNMYEHEVGNYSYPTDG